MRRDQDIIGYMYNDTEQIIREKIAKEIEEAPHHHDLLNSCDGCKDKEFYLGIIRRS